MTTFALADVPAPQVVLDTGQSIAASGDTRAAKALPAGATSPERWQKLVQAIASASAMYRYPTGEQWPFVLPSTADELLDDIRDFDVGREPAGGAHWETGQWLVTEGGRIR